jgi:hypothetical protein
VFLLTHPHLEREHGPDLGGRHHAQAAHDVERQAELRRVLELAPSPYRRRRAIAVTAAGAEQTQPEAGRQRAGWRGQLVAVEHACGGKSRAHES